MHQAEQLVREKKKENLGKQITNDPIAYTKAKEKELERNLRKEGKIKSI